MKEVICAYQKSKWTRLVLVDAITFAKNQKSLKQFYLKSKFACSREHDIISSENREHATCQKGISPPLDSPVFICFQQKGATQYAERFIYLIRGTMVDRQDYFQKYREAYKQKKRRVTITMDLEDYAKFARDAEKLGASIPETIKAKALESEAKMVPQVNKELAGELGFLLRNMANNINQIAHNMNLNRHLYGPETNSHAHKVLQQLQDKLMHLEEELHTVLLLHER